MAQMILHQQSSRRKEKFLPFLRGADNYSNLLQHDRDSSTYPTAGLTD